MTPHSIAIALHVLGAILWVGGLYFMVSILRPVAEELLEPPLRQALMYKTMGRFFVRLWVIVLGILATGFFMIFMVYGGFGALPVRIHVMTTIGLVMTAIFAYVHGIVYPAVGRALSHQNYKEGKRMIHRIRDLARVNLGLGTLLVLIVYGLKFVS